MPAATLTFATSNGSPTAGQDYTASTGILSFALGETAQTFTVAIRNDADLESNETVNLTLSAPSTGTLGTPSTAV